MKICMIFARGVSHSILEWNKNAITNFRETSPKNPSLELAITRITPARAIFCNPLFTSKIASSAPKDNFVTLQTMFSSHFHISLPLFNFFPPIFHISSLPCNAGQAYSLLLISRYVLSRISLCHYFALSYLPSCIPYVRATRESGDWSRASTADSQKPHAGKDIVEVGCSSGGERGEEGLRGRRLREEGWRE